MVASRDRTGLFLRFREEARTLHRRPLPVDDRPHINNALSSHSTTESTVSHGGMEPDWVYAYNELKGDINEIDKMLEQLGGLYAQHLLPSFEAYDTSHLENEIRLRSHRLTDMLHSVEQKVRTLHKAPSKHGEDDDESDEIETIIRKNLQKRFATPLQNLSMNFRKRQKLYLDKLRTIRQVEGEDVNMNAPNQAQQENDQGEHSDDLSQTQLIEIENASVTAEQRRRELARIASNINDLATLVKDIAVLVVDQGTVLDRIDYNLEDVRQTTRSAVRELRTAEQYQRKRHALCCIILLAIGCGFNIIILIYKWTS